jgi:uncharacterized protein
MGAGTAPLLSVKTTDVSRKTWRNVTSADEQVLPDREQRELDALPSRKRQADFDRGLAELPDDAFGWFSKQGWVDSAWERPIDKPEELNFILGQSHFIKTVEDLYEALVGASPHLRFGFAFCESFGPRLVRRAGNDDELVELATRNAVAIGAGHSFIVFLREGFPVNVLNQVKQVPEVCRIYCATANRVEVILAESEQGRAILGVVARREARKGHGKHEHQTDVVATQPACPSPARICATPLSPVVGVPDALLSSRRGALAGDRHAGHPRD